MFDQQSWRLSAFYCPLQNSRLQQPFSARNRSCRGIAHHFKQEKQSLHPSRQPSWEHQGWRNLRVNATAIDASTPVGVGEIADVEDMEGIRVVVGEANRPLIHYLVKWKDRQDHTWEPVENLSDNLLRDFEDKWWKICRDGDEEAMRNMLEKSRDVLPHCVDSNERSALHFAAAIGQTKCCAMLCEAGADVDQSDKDGYTPLHMAVGYSHVGAVKALLDAGASPEIPDNQGRNVVQLVDSIRDSMPYTPQLAGKRLALEEVAAMLAGNLFEEVLPKKVLDCRTIANGSKEYLIQWLDDSDDSWVKESDMSKEILEDYHANFEYASADRLLKMKKRGDQRLYLVRWLDGAADSWEFEDHLSPALIQAFESGEQDAFAKLDIPASLLEEKPISKRAARRARKAARRAALASEAAGSPSINGASIPGQDSSGEIDTGTSQNGGSSEGEKGAPDSKFVTLRADSKEDQQDHKENTRGNNGDRRGGAQKELQKRETVSV